jgi:putative ABC transport system permease protein
VSTPVTEAAVDEIEEVPGVLAAEAVSQISATATFAGEGFSTSGVGYDPGTTMHGFPDGLPPEGVLAGSGLTDQLDVEIGDELHVSLPDLGIEFTSEVVEFLDEPVGTILYIDRSHLGDIVGSETLAEPTVSHIQARFDDDADRSTVIGDIEQLETVALVSDSRALYDVLQDYLGFFYAFVGVMLVLGGAMAFALMYNSISVNVAERSSELANMRANGLSHAAIARLIGFENILLTMMGIVPGVILGWAIGYLFMRQFSVDAFTLDFAMRPSSIVISILALIAAAGLSLIPAIRKIGKIDIGEIVRERAV